MAAMSGFVVSVAVVEFADMEVCASPGAGGLAWVRVEVPWGVGVVW